MLYDDTIAPKESKKPKPAAAEKAKKDHFEKSAPEGATPAAMIGRLVDLAVDGDGLQGRGR